jgi:hypothetical protein
VVSQNPVGTLARIPFFSVVSVRAVSSFFSFGEGEVELMYRVDQKTLDEFGADELNEIERLLDTQKERT